MNGDILHDFKFASETCFTWIEACDTHSGIDDAPAHIEDMGKRFVNNVENAEKQEHLDESRQA